MKISIIGLSLSSSYGNGHATTYRSLIKALHDRGHRVDFYERSEPWYGAHRDLPPCETLFFYATADQLLHERRSALEDSDLVIVGSFVKEATSLVDALQKGPRGALAFYDLDAPVTLATLKQDRCEYLRRDLLSAFDLYLTSSGGVVLDELEALGARRALSLYCSVDPDVHGPVDVPLAVDLGYLGKYSPDRLASMNELLLEPAATWSDGQFTVAGPYPDRACWPANVRHVPHIPPTHHAEFYCSQRFTLNLTRSDARQLGYTPSVRLFEAACCGTPIISDRWDGLDTLFAIGEEILIAEDGSEVLRYMRKVSDEDRKALGAAARRRVLTRHTGAQRAAELESYVETLC